jgi:hypothetical protein
MNSTRLAESSESALSFCRRISWTMAWNCGQAGVSRMGVSTRSPLMPAAGDSARTRSFTPSSKSWRRNRAYSLIVGGCRLEFVLGKPSFVELQQFLQAHFGQLEIGLFSLFQFALQASPGQFPVAGSKTFMNLLASVAEAGIIIFVR